MKKNNQINSIIEKIPNFIYEDIDRDNFCVFLKEVMNNLDLKIINKKAMIVYLKQRFKLGDLDVIKNAFFINNNCQV